MDIAAWDALVKELRAALIELGVLPKGSYADVAARLAAIPNPASPADGDIIIRSGGAWIRLPKGTDGYVLTLVAGLPDWAAGGGGAGIPAGLIAIWHGLIANIPSGWVICDGNNSTPNLLDKFVKGVPTAATNPGSTGGAASVTLDATQIPSHQHSISEQAAHTHDVGTLAAAGEAAHTHGVGTLAVANEAAHTHGAGSFAAASNGAHSHTIDKSWDLEEGNEPITGVSHTGTMNTSSAGAHGHSISGTSGAGSSHTHGLSGATAAGSSHTHTLSGATASGSAHSHGGNTGLIGGGLSHENRPPYYEVAFIMKT
jgi:microcystin-dependent protein